MGTEIKVYAINETEYVAATSELEAALEYAHNMSHPVERCVEEGLIDTKNGFPVALTASEMEKAMFEDVDDPSFGKPEYQPISFRQQLENQVARGVKFPLYFAGEL